MNQTPDNDDLARRGKMGYDDALAKAIEEATANKDLSAADAKHQRTLIDVDACGAVFKRMVRKQNVRLNPEEGKRIESRYASVDESRYADRSPNKSLAYIGGAVALVLVAIFSIFVIMRSLEAGKHAAPAADQSPPVVAK